MPLLFVENAPYVPMSLLERLPPPLLDDLIAGRWLPMIGSGYSKNAHLPPGETMPDWRQLADQLAADLPDYESESPIDTISAYEEAFGRSRIVERMSDLLHIRSARPGRAHEMLCRVAPDILLTTNFDFLLERAFDDIRQPCRPLLTEDQLPQAPLEGQSRLLKLHGDLNHPRQLVATEDDFDSFLAARPLMATFTANLLVTVTPVLIGYSFDDPDMRSIWSLIRGRLGSLRRRGYVLKVKTSSTEIARFRRRGFIVVELPGDDYEAVFAELFEELGAALGGSVTQVANATEDEIAAQLILPPDEPSRLCFCAVPVRLLPWYRREIFPIIEEAGYVTVTRDEIIPVGANVATTVRALLARSELALVDAGSFSTSFELGMAVQELGPERVVVLLDVDQQVPADLRGVRVLFRAVDSIEHPESLIAELRSAIPRADAGRQRSQPGQLLQQGHFNAAVAVTFGLLEQQLRTQFAAGSERPPSLIRLVGLAADAGFLTDEERQRFQQWIGLRNYAVHSGDEVDPHAARLAVGDVEMLLARLSDKQPPD